MLNRDVNQRVDHAGQGPSAPPPGPAPELDEGVDAGQIWVALRDNRRLIFAVAICFAVLVALATLYARMDFKSYGRIYLGELETKMAAMTSTDKDFVSDPSDLGSEIEILSSTELIDRAISASGINTGIGPIGWEPPRYWRWRAAGRNQKVLDVGLQELRPVNTSIRDHYEGIREFQIRFVAADTYEVWVGDSRRLGRGTLGKPFKAEDLKLTLLPGTVRRPAVGAQYLLEVRPLEEVKREVLKSLAIGYPKAITQTEAPRVVSLDFSSPSPYLAASFLRELMKAYLDERSSWKTENASAAEVFVTNQLRGIRESLDQTEKRLTDYRTNHASVALDNEAEAMIGQIGRYEEQRVAARLELATLTDLKRALKDPNSHMEAYLASGVTDSVLDGLTTTLSESRKALASALARSNNNPNAPDVRMHKSEVDAALGVIKNYVDTRYARAQQSLTAMNQVIGQFEQKLQTVPGAELGLAQLARESEVYSKLYSYLLERQQQAAIYKASTVSKNRIIDAPIVPTRESSPMLLARVAVSLFGLVLGLVIVVLRLAFSPTIQSEYDVQRIAGRLPIFASIPRRDPSAKKKAGEAGYDLLSEQPSSPFAEAFRMLRANLYQVSSSGDGKVILFTSPVPGDGKSTSAIALSVMLAADSKTVLLIDADIRKPSHHRALHQPLEPGLSEVLLRERDWLTATRAISTAYGDFYAITAGRMAAAELLSHESMTTFLETARKRFDYIIIDSASFPLVSDALVLSPYADCVLSVLRLKHTPKKLAAQHLRRMSGLAAEYGVMVNGASPNEGYGYVAEHPRKRVRGEVPTGSASTRGSTN